MQMAVSARRDAYEMGLLACRRMDLLLRNVHELHHASSLSTVNPVKKTATEATDIFLKGLHYKPDPQSKSLQFSTELRLRLGQIVRVLQTDSLSWVLTVRCRISG